MLSTAGLIGAAVAFAFAVGVYLATTSALKRVKLEPGGSADAREQSASTIRMILLADIPILTVIGYFISQMFQ